MSISAAESTVPPHADFERFRFNMIEQQIRPWDVLEPSVLDLLYVVKREDFVPAHLRALAFTDFELPLNLDGEVTGETMLAPKIEAKLLQELRIHPHEQVLEIGTGSGYMAALLAAHADRVWSVEIVPELAETARENLRRQGIAKVSVETGDAALGWPAQAPYDVIMVSGSLPLLPPELLAQLKVGGRLAAVVGCGPAMSAQIVTRVTNGNYETLPLFETVTKPLRNALQPSAFRF